MNHYPFRRDEYPDLTHTIKTVVGESHTRAQLEKLSTTRLRELKKTYEARVLKGDKDAARELADIRGLLRSKGAGHALEEGSACERAAMARLKAANAEDLKEKPGKAGEAAHKRLHKTIKTVVGEGQEYAEFLEGIIDTLCEELGLDPDALLEDVQTFEREKETQAERKRLERERDAGRRKNTAAGDKEERSASAKIRRRDKLSDKEYFSKQLYGKGGKVIRKGTAKYKRELERSQKQRAADARVRQQQYDAAEARRRRTNPNWREEDAATYGGYGTVGAYRKATQPKGPDPHDGYAGWW